MLLRTASTRGGSPMRRAISSAARLSAPAGVIAPLRQAAEHEGPSWAVHGLHGAEGVLQQLETPPLGVQRRPDDGPEADGGQTEALGVSRAASGGGGVEV